MKIALTGGTGLIGNALGKKLVEEGHTLRVLTRRPGTARADLAYPCELFEWDGLGPVPDHAIQGIDAFIHLAGENIAAQRWTNARMQTLRDSRVKPLQQLKQAFERLKIAPQVFITSSGIGVYGDRGDELLNEDSKPGDDFLAKLCVDWESAATAVPAARHVAMRTGVVIASGGGFLSQVTPLFAAFGASRLGSGEQWFAWIQIDDLISIFMDALRNQSLSGVVNATSPNPLKNRQLTKILKDVLDVPSAPAAPALGLKALYGKLSSALLSSQRAYSKKLQDRGFKWKWPHFEAAVLSTHTAMKRGELQLVFENWVPRVPEEIWPFFCDEKNLEKLTPNHLSFHVLGKNTDKIGAGTLIDYKIKVRGIPMRWTSRIGNWDPPNEFSDEQVKGPYRTWLHSHRFRELGGGTLMTDTIRFSVPAGMLGRAVALFHVKSEVEGIFSYRSKIIKEIFSSR